MRKAALLKVVIAAFFLIPTLSYSGGTNLVLDTQLASTFAFYDTLGYKYDHVNYHASSSYEWVQYCGSDEGWPNLPLISGSYTGCTSPDPNIIDCTAGQSSWTYGTGSVAEPNLCISGCNGNLQSQDFNAGYTIEQGYPVDGQFWVAWYQTDGTTCENNYQPPSPSPFDLVNDPTNDCADSNLGLYCPGQNEPQDPPDNCTTFKDSNNNPITYCSNQPMDQCIVVNDNVMCANPTPDCGEINGKWVCIDPLPGADPYACIEDGGSKVCIEPAPKDQETSTTETIVNPDGTTTTTTTTTDGGTITTSITTTSADGLTSSTVTTTEGEEAQQYPTVPEPDEHEYDDKFTEMFQQLQDGMGNDTVDDQGLGSFNPLGGLSSSGCTQMVIGIGPWTTNFPGVTGCTMLTKLKQILTWAVLVITAYALISMAFRRPV